MKSLVEKITDTMQVIRDLDRLVDIISKVKKMNINEDKKELEEMLLELKEISERNNGVQTKEIEMAIEIMKRLD